jgi:hypothetical protein
MKSLIFFLHFHLRLREYENIIKNKEFENIIKAKIKAIVEDLMCDGGKYIFIFRAKFIERVFARLYFI